LRTALQCVLRSAAAPAHAHAQISTVAPRALDAPHFASLDKWEGGVCANGELW
jgi:hypothetical protein